MRRRYKCPDLIFCFCSHINIPHSIGLIIDSINAYSSTQQDIEESIFHRFQYPIYNFTVPAGAEHFFSDGGFIERVLLNHAPKVAENADIVVKTVFHQGSRFFAPFFGRFFAGVNVVKVFTDKVNCTADKLLSQRSPRALFAGRWQIMNLSSSHIRAATTSIMYCLLKKHFKDSK